MYIGGLMVSETDFRCGNPGSFPRREGYEFTLNFYEDSNEKRMGRKQKEEVLWSNVGKHR